MSALGQALVRLYPRRWRKRYGDEMREMLAGRRLTLRALTDVLAGAIDARVNPQWTPSTPATEGAKAMTMSKILRCGAPAGVSVADQWRSAAWMLGTSLGLVILSSLVKQRIGPNAFSESLLLSAFPAALMMSNESMYFRRYSRTARTVLSLGGALFIILVIWAAEALD